MAKCQQASIILKSKMKLRSIYFCNPADRQNEDEPDKRD